MSADKAPLKIYLIAGEASGDRLGAQAMAEMKKTLSGYNISFYGVGGDLMETQGIASLFPMEDLSVMGITEVLPKLNLILKRIKQTIVNIEIIKPDIVLSIDSPDFCFRVCKAIKQRANIKTKLVHYVAPTVWAWRPKRAKKIARFLDAILCLFPFEPPYFEAEELPAEFVGHPILNSGLLEANGDIYRKEAGLACSDQTLGVFLGSRRGEIDRMGPVFADVLDRLAKDHVLPHIIVPTLPHLKDQAFNALKSYKGKIHITTSHEMKWHAFKACDAAIAVSGTVGLELAVAGVPHLIAYKVHPITAEIVRHQLKTPYVHLGNIILQNGVIPEFIQDHCKADLIASEIKGILQDDQKQDQQKQQFQKIKNHIKPNKDNALSGFIETLV